VKRGLLVNLSLSLVVTVLFLAGLEGAARLVERQNPPEEREVADYIWNWDAKMPGGFYVMRSEAVGWPPYQEFNGDGLRDRTRPRTKPGGTWRIAVLGDSVTLGSDLKPHQAYPRLLEARLQGAGRRIEVLSVALWGWSTRQERIAWHRIARGYDPDQVILAVCLNDIPELHNNLTRPPGWVIALHRHSALVRRLVDAEGREIENVERLFESPDDPRVQAAMEEFFEEVRTLRREVEDDGASFAMIVFPFRFQLQGGAPPAVVQERIAAFCEADGLECLDMLPVLERLGPQAFLDYDHLSRQGSSVTADTLLASGLIPAGFSSPQTLRAALSGRDLDGGEAVLAWLESARPPLPAAGRPAVTALLQSTDPEVRRAAAWAAGRLDPEGAEVPPLVVELLGTDPDAGVRAMAASSLGALGAAGRPGLAALFEALEDPDEAVRHAAAQALAEQRLSLDDIASLERALGSADTYVRGFAAWRLGNFGAGAAPAVPRLASILEEPDTHVVVSAALARIGPGAVEAVPVLQAELVSPDAGRRWRAAKALGRIGSGAAPAVGELVKALSDPNERVRRHAARALGRIGPAAEAAAPELQRATGDADRAVQREARKALDRLQR
jgi:hypothetical protein